MRITYKGVVLSDGGKGSPVALSTGGRKQLQFSQPLRGDYSRVIDRRGRLNTFGWEHTREFESASQAQAFMLLHAAAIPDGEGDLIITLDDDTVITLHDAVLEVPTGERYAGVRTYHRYQATGRQLTGGTLPGWIDPNLGTAIPAYAVTYQGEYVFHDGDYVTHSPY
jgi:hypothetical protein